MSSTAPGRCGRWSSCANAVGPCWCWRIRAASCWSGLLGEPMAVGHFLHLALGLVAALGRDASAWVHPQGPQAGQYPGESGERRGPADRVRHRLPPAARAPAPEPPEVIAGTLAYMAPEQTGRMNRSIDSRSDLYALGVTLYQMLTGTLPFTASDPMEWVHCHIARQPVPPGRALAERSGGTLGHHHEAARQDGRGALPDRRRPGARSAALPGRMGSPGPHRRLPARRTRHARPAADSRETVRASARGRDLARRLRSRRQERRAGAGAGLRLFRHRQVLRRQRTAQGAGAAARALRRQASSTSTNATFLIRRWRRLFRASSGRCSARARPS